jgi:hypothetical protein
MEAGSGERSPSVPVATEMASTQTPAPQAVALPDPTALAHDKLRGEVASTPTCAPRPNSKLGRVVGMLGAEAGATISELTAATGWLKHTTRAALTGLRHRGYELSLARKQRDGDSVYRIVAHADEAAR